MDTGCKQSEISRIFLEPGDVVVPDVPNTLAAVLGSCVAVTLFDRRRKMGGMSHFRFPLVRRAEDASPEYGNIAVPLLVRIMLEGGSKLCNLEAQVFGGAHDPRLCAKDIGRSNVAAACRSLEKKGVPVVSRDVGGMKGRKLLFHVQRNETLVIKVDRIRAADWYPYLTGGREGRAFGGKSGC